MIDRQSIAEAPIPHIRKIPIHERSVRVGDVIVVNGYRANRTLLKKRFAEGGYHLHETGHFLLFTRAEEPKIILVHWFAPEEITIDIPNYLANELKPFSIIKSNQQLGELFAGIVEATQFPGDIQGAWHYFGSNTLQHLLTLLGSASTLGISDYGIFATSAFLYQRVFELSVGEYFLDAACNGGFLSLLLAERMPFVREAVGIDIDADAFKIAQELAAERHLTKVRYMQGDLRAADFSTIGTFDTVTALHVLEHFTETDMYRVLANLLKVTAHRLIFAVPYETGEPSAAYGHKQLFTQTKLEAVGAWCIQQFQGAARMWYEDLPRGSGLLLVERVAQ